MNLLQLLLKSMISSQSVNSVSKKTGINAELVTRLIVAALPVLIKYMTKNASSQTGAASLLSALTQHKVTKTMAEQIDEVDEVDGGKIINHILGEDTDKVVRALSEETGANSEQVTKTLGSIAPALLSGLSAAAQAASSMDKADDVFDLGDLLTMFAGAAAAQQQPQQTSLLGSLFGLQQPQQQVQQVQQPSVSSALLGSLLGMQQAQPVQQVQQTQQPSLLGSLLGVKPQQTQQVQQPVDASIDGSQLLGLLTALMK